LNVFVPSCDGGDVIGVLYKDTAIGGVHTLLSSSRCPDMMLATSSRSRSGDMSSGGGVTTVSGVCIVSISSPWRWWMLKSPKEVRDAQLGCWSETAMLVKARSSPWAVLLLRGVWSVQSQLCFELGALRGQTEPKLKLQFFDRNSYFF